MNLNTSKKQILVGLDNSGKTSLSLALKNNYTKIGLTKPTYLVDRGVFKYLNYDIIQHDFGGQRKYLITYLKEPGKYFNETDVAAYVIDIQDTERFDESLDYFKDMLASFDDLDLNPEIWILFHKAEKYLIEGDEEELVVVESLKKRIKEINKKRFSISFEITSIYDRWSVVRAFGKIFNALYPKNEKLDATMKELADTINASLVSIIDDNVLVVGTYSRDKAQEDLLSYTVPHLYKIKTDLDEKSGHKDLVTLQKGGFGYAFVDLHASPVKLYVLAIGIKNFTTEALLIQEIESFTYKILNALDLLEGE